MIDLIIVLHFNSLSISIRTSFNWIIYDINLKILCEKLVSLNEKPK